MSYVFDIIIKKLLRWNGESEPFVCQEKRKKKRKGGCNRQLIALPFTKNSPLFRFKRIHSISKLISFGFSTLHSPWIPSFCDFSTIFLIDCDSIETWLKRSRNFEFLVFVGSTENYITRKEYFNPRVYSGGYISVVGGGNFQFTVGFNTSRHAPEKKKRFSKTLRKDYITIFKGQGVSMVNFYFPRSTWGPVGSLDIFFIKLNCFSRINQSEALDFHKVSKKYTW